ncbi:Vam6/Vps39 protein [Fasciola gigantica]|uniref:Vam6/Vps39 protein n=1 Tax=Fasciola gigantica TaxID=46835 RepID=A0A504Z1W3_FASGI|nr:Vam6/Vps39 protein [Fasciola gigantica]
MHDAFLPICSLRDYPYALECLACHDNFLLVGTKQGLLLIYEVTPKSLNHATYFVPPMTTRMVPRKAIPLNLKANKDEILRLDESAESPGTGIHAPPPAFSNRVHTTRTLGKKPILQLAAIPELDMLLALAEGKMNVYQLQNYQLITMVPNSRGATVFAHCLSMYSTP